MIFEKCRKFRKKFFESEKIEKNFGKRRKEGNL